MDMGNINESINYYKRAIELQPNYAYAYGNLGNAQSKAGLLNEAINNYKRTISLDEGNPLPHYNLAIVYLKKEMFDEALAEFKIAASMGHEGAKKELEYRQDNA